MSETVFDGVHLLAMSFMLFGAMWKDAVSRRIPNSLVLAGALVALFLSVTPHGTGVASALLGGVIGLLLFSMFYIVRVLGAGDVKLMTAMGIFVGDLDIWMLSLSVLMAGGLLAIFWAIWTERWREVLSNLVVVFFHVGQRWSEGSFLSVKDVPVSGERMPYALAIGLGTAWHLLSLKG
jgi:prepilin peptidase CpaA